MDNKLSPKEKRLLQLLERIITQVTHFKNTSGIDRLPKIKWLAEQGIELIDPENKLINEQ